MSRIIDGHIHVTEELLPILRNNRVCCIANADNPLEYAMLQAAGIPEMVISAGIHPWKADVTDWEAMEPVLQEVEIIGEIGLDNVWCDVNMDIQREVFRRQLEVAAQMKKPVVLHTKGMEKEILDTIRHFPNRYLVHWYSCAEYLSEYIDLGCWFTIGPSVMPDKNVEAVARNVPANRLFIESDGLDGIRWGQNRELGVQDYIEAMEEHLRAVAAIRGWETEILLKQMEQNLREFVGCRKE